MLAKSFISKPNDASAWQYNQIVGTIVINADRIRRLLHYKHTESADRPSVSPQIQVRSKSLLERIKSGRITLKQNSQPFV